MTWPGPAGGLNAAPIPTKNAKIYQLPGAIGWRWGGGIHLIILILAQKEVHASLYLRDNILIMISYMLVLVSCFIR